MNYNSLFIPKNLIESNPNPMSETNCLLQKLISKIDILINKVDNIYPGNQNNNQGNNNTQGYNNKQGYNNNQDTMDVTTDNAMDNTTDNTNRKRKRRRISYHGECPIFLDKSPKNKDTLEKSLEEINQTLKSFSINNNSKINSNSRQCQEQDEKDNHPDWRHLYIS